jgi:hypothetical protein
MLTLHVLKIVVLYNSRFIHQYSEEVYGVSK